MPCRASADEVAQRMDVKAAAIAAWAGAVMAAYAEAGGRRRAK
jgi:hypothetical protein